MDPRRSVGLLVAVLLGLAAASARWLAEYRPRAAFLAPGRIVVTSTRDDGPGSLREAIFAADRSDAPAVISLRVRRVALKSPLPPLVNPKGVVIDAKEARTEIDARELASESVIELRTPNSIVEGLKIARAAGTAVLVRAPQVHLRSVDIVDCAAGVTLGEGASDVLIEDSRFEANGTGVRVPAGTPRVTLRRNRFARHDQAAVWAVSPDPSTGAGSAGLVVRENAFEGDRISVVLIHIPGRVEHNQFLGAREAAVYVMGDGGIVRENRAREGAILGIFADEAQGALIEGNELDHNAAVGIILRSGGASVVQKNRVYANGYGIAVVFGEKSRPNVVSDNLFLAQTQDAVYVVGGSPLIQRNRALDNGAAGVRILDLIPHKGPRIAAEPLLLDNVFRRNLLDAPVRGEYRLPAAEEREER